MSLHEDNLRVASINANTAFVSNIDLYTTFMRHYCIHILLIQEAGPLPMLNNTTVNHDTHPHFALRSANIFSFTRKIDGYPHSQVILCSKDVMPFVSQLADNSDLPSQYIKLTEPFNITIGNVYLDNPAEPRQKKLKNIMAFTSKIDRLVLGGDFNSIANSKKDYYSTRNSYQAKTHCLLKECLTTRKMIDTFRYLHREIGSLEMDHQQNIKFHHRNKN